MSPTGRKIHEEILEKSGYTVPIKIGILETPTGFEVNAIHAWPARIQEFFQKGLQNMKPEITRIRAWRKVGIYSTDDPDIVDVINDQDYLYAGAGSPSYVVTHLADSRALEKMKAAHQAGTILCLGSATAVAMGRFSLPVYEIFKAGLDLFWLQGLDLFSMYGLNLAIIPHWNNHEGEDFDTTRCWMGVERFKKLQVLLPGETVILGIDENTAANFDFLNKQVEVMGMGNVTVIKAGKEQIYQAGEVFGVNVLK